MELLERDKYLGELEHSFNRLSDGSGLVVLISGEAGIGKTSLVESFVQTVEERATILWGTCDALFTPRPLGPLYDIASQLKNGLLNLLNSQASRPVIFSKFLENLQSKQKPNIVIIEDVHWADESTLDLIKYLGRRANRTTSLFIITFRDDEISSEHPLRFVLGDISSQNLIKINLPLLTEKTVNDLAETHRLKNLYVITGGNPFLITELLNNKNEGVPSTIKDSILTRISRLSNNAKELIQLVSIVPTKTEKWLIDGIVNFNTKILEECLNSGLVELEEEAISFRHELSRVAVEESLSESKRQLLNEKFLQVLLKQKDIDNYLARIIHHAARALNKEAIINYAPYAAKQASILGSHSLAAEHYKNALRFVDRLPVQKQITLYEGRSCECYLTGQVEEGIKACEAVIDILKLHSNPFREGENYRRLARLLWYAGQDFKSEECLYKAIKLLEKETPSKELAMTYSNLSQLYMCRANLNLTIKWAKKAEELSKTLNDLEIKVHALNNIGTGKMMAGNRSGETYLKESLNLSIKNNYHEHASRAYDNLGIVYVWERNLQNSLMYFSEGLDYCNDKDIDTLGLCIVGGQTKTKLHLGNWDNAIESASIVLKQGNVPLMNRIIPLYIVGIIRTRRNDPGAANKIKELNSLGSNCEEVVEMIVPIKAALAESFWLNNNLGQVIDEVELIYNKIKNRQNPFAVGELAYWLWKGNNLKHIPKNIAKPFLLQIKGDWKSAAKLWEELQCPYEQALALSEGNEQSMKRAVEIFDRLGASATSQLIKQKMRESGIKNVPKGPRKSTKRNPSGLTSRQLEVLSLVGEGLSNIEIGKKLFISQKTVDHHISAILSKLNIHSRYEAATYFHSNLAVIK
ncbi:MAG: AAA family ATPase [Ignavibacteriaceae bacterium]